MRQLIWMEEKEVESKTVVFRFNIFFYFSCLIIIWKLFFSLFTITGSSLIAWVGGVCLNHKVTDYFMFFFNFYILNFKKIFSRPNIVVLTSLVIKKVDGKAISTCSVKMCESILAFQSMWERIWALHCQILVFCTVPKRSVSLFLTEISLHFV